jgi:hypothetical protein
MSRRSASVRRFAPFLPLLVLGACSTVLGIEDVEEDPNASQGGSSMTTDVAGGAKNTGGSKAGSATTASMGGSNGEGGDGPGPLGGDGSMGGGSEPMGGDTGMAGAPNPDDPTVRGTVIDFWGTPVPNIPVQVGETLTNTDEDGEFVVEDVGTTYDVSLALEFSVNATPRYHGYAFLGLTRRDPTFQVRQGFDFRTGTAVITPANVTVETEDIIKLAVGGKTGNVSTSVGVNGSEQTCYWEGTETANQTAHALHLSRDDDTELPTSYKAYDSTTVGLAETGKSSVTLDLTPDTIVSGNLVGTATTGGGMDRVNYVFLRFDTGAAMELISDSGGPNSFSYLVPTIPSSTLTVAASEGWDSDDGPFALVYKTGLASADKPDLKIPTPATLAAPASGATGVTATTQFTFTAPASNPGPFVVHFTNADINGPWEDLWVVTADKKLTIPSVLEGGFALNANNLHSWNVETHGSFASVDAMTGPEGFWDMFMWQSGPVGPLTDDGAWTMSAPRNFTTAP